MKQERDALRCHNGHYGDLCSGMWSHDVCYVRRDNLPPSSREKNTATVVEIAWIYREGRLLSGLFSTFRGNILFLSSGMNIRRGLESSMAIGTGAPREPI